jgi:hypothetical protein
MHIGPGFARSCFNLHFVPLGCTVDKQLQQQVHTVMLRCANNRADSAWSSVASVCNSIAIHAAS